jgi:hypothetical protein
LDGDLEEEAGAFALSLKDASQLIIMIYSKKETYGDTALDGDLEEEAGAFALSLKDASQLIKLRN